LFAYSSRYVIEKRHAYFTSIFPNTKGIKVSLSEIVKGSVYLNRKMFCVCGLSKGIESGIVEYINWELSGNDKGDDQS
jgi:hypothetical protein